MEVCYRQPFCAFFETFTLDYFLRCENFVARRKVVAIFRRRVQNSIFADANGDFRFSPIYFEKYVEKVGDKIRKIFAEIF